MSFFTHYVHKERPEESLLRSDRILLVFLVLTLFALARIPQRHFFMHYVHKERPEPDSNRRVTVLQTVALANLAIGPQENYNSLCRANPAVAIAQGDGYRAIGETWIKPCGKYLA